jgi:hypothetical protein
MPRNRQTSSESNAKDAPPGEPERIGKLLAQVESLPLGRYPTLTSSWHSRTSRLYSFAAFDSPDRAALVKVLTASQDALVLADSIERTNSAIESVPGMRPLGLLAVFEDVPCVVMERVDGMSLSALVQERLRSRRHWDDVLPHFRTAGAALAAYHAASLYDSLSHRDEAIAHVQRVAEYARATSLTSADKMKFWESEVIEHFGDHLPHHLILMADSKIVRIDPPMAKRRHFREYDIAYFLMTLGAIVWRGRMLFNLRIARRLDADVRSAFIAGYFAYRGQGQSELDLTRIRAWETLISRRRMQHRYEGGFPSRLAAALNPRLVLWRLGDDRRLRKLRAQMNRMISGDGVRS